MRNPILELIRNRRFGAPIVIVSGLPRSGTSMVMKMLQSGGLAVFTDATRRADDDNPEGYFEHERVKELGRQADKSWVREARGKALKVISHLITELPPDNYYRIIFARRDLKEVVASQNIMLARRGEPNPVADAEAEELYGKHLLHVALHIDTQSNMELLAVQYSDILRDPRGWAVRIDQFIGCGLNTDAMARAVDPGLYRNRAPELARVLERSS